MEKISYEKFVKLLNEFTVFDEVTLKSLYKKYGKNLIDSYFDMICSNLNEQEFMIFSKKYSCFFDNIVLNELNDDFDPSSLKSLNYTFYFLGVKDTSLMSQNEEIYYGTILKEAKENLQVCQDSENLYPILCEMDIIKSLYFCGNARIDLLKDIKSLPYKLHDDNIFKGSLNNIKLYLKIKDNLSYDELQNHFKGIENAKVIGNIVYQLELLKKYVIAKNNFFKRNIKLLYFVAKKYYNYNLSCSDLIQEGTLGLIEAINKYDYTKGNRFSTYATYWIKQKILRALITTGDTIRKPYLAIKQKKQYNEFISEYFLKNNKYPSIDEISENTGISISEINDLITNYGSCLSLDCPILSDEEDSSLKNVIPDGKESIETTIIDKELSIIIEKSFSECLSEREIDVIQGRFGLNGKNEMTLEHLAKEYGVSRQRIKQIEQKSLKKLKNNDNKFGLKDYL